MTTAPQREPPLSRTEVKGQPLSRRDGRFTASSAPVAVPAELAPPTCAQEIEFRVCWSIGSAVCSIAVGMFDAWRETGAFRSWMKKRTGAFVAAVRSRAGRIVRARGV